MVYLFVVLALILLNSAIRIMTSFHIYIDVFDMVLVIGTSWMVCHWIFNIHSAISLIIGLIISQVLYLIFRTRIGFWIITPIFSALWALVTTSLVMCLFGIWEDRIWFWTLIIPNFAYNCWLHSISLARAQQKKGPLTIDLVYPGETPSSSEMWLDPRDGEFHPVSEKPFEADDPDWIREAYKMRDSSTRKKI